MQRKMVYIKDIKNFYNQINRKRKISTRYQKLQIRYKIASTLNSQLPTLTQVAIFRNDIFDSLIENYSISLGFLFFRNI